MRFRLHGTTQLAESDKNVATDYIEMEIGVVVIGTTAGSICASFCNILKEVKEGKDMTLPKSWTNIGQNECKFILNKLYPKFPYIRLCNDDWKGCYLAGCVLMNMNNTEKC